MRECHLFRRRRYRIQQFSVKPTTNQTAFYAPGTVSLDGNVPTWRGQLTEKRFAAVHRFSFQLFELKQLLMTYGLGSLAINAHFKAPPEHSHLDSWGGATWKVWFEKVTSVPRFGRSVQYCNVDVCGDSSDNLLNQSAEAHRIIYRNINTTTRRRSKKKSKQPKKQSGSKTE